MQAFAIRFAYFAITSYTLAVTTYYALAAVLTVTQGGHHPASPFGALYRMFLYHWAHPLAYIALPCFWYSVLAASLAPQIAALRIAQRIASTWVLCLGAVLLATPFGGMLWHWHDMQAGHFPAGWPAKLLGGAADGVQIGPAIILLSVPYNLIGLIAAVPLTRSGGRLDKDLKLTALLRRLARPAWFGAVLGGLLLMSYMGRDVVQYRWRMIHRDGRVSQGAVLQGQDGSDPAGKDGVLIRHFADYDHCTVTYDDRARGESLHVMGPAGKRWSSDAEIHWARSEGDALEVHRSVGLGDEFVRASEKPYSAQDERTTVTLRPGGLHLRRVQRGGAPWSGAFVEYANGARRLVRYEAGKAVERMAAEEPTDLQTAVAAMHDPEGATWIQQLLAELEARRTRLRTALGLPAGATESCDGLE